jgi:hypothetical protein
MRALADFIMRGRGQAALVMGLAVSLPMLFWVGAAAGSLVLLRRGLKDALSVVVWSLFPVVLWWYYGEPRPLMVVTGTLVLAQVLRNSQSWPRVLLTSMALGVLFAVVVGQVFAESVQHNVQALQGLLPQVLGDGYRQLSAADQARLGEVIQPILIGMMAALLQLICLMALLLARYWQAALYNPGGLGREFRVLRFHPAVSGALLLAMLLSPAGGPEQLMLAPMFSVPLLIAGLAVVHGLSGQKRIAGFWVVGTYVSLVLFTQLMYPLLVLLAVVDSLIDFRRVARGSDPQGPANGEG